jgi:hypothetical protein
MTSDAVHSPCVASASLSNDANNDQSLICARTFAIMPANPPHTMRRVRSEVLVGVAGVAADMFAVFSVAMVGESTAFCLCLDYHSTIRGREGRTDIGRYTIYSTIL